MGHFLLAVKLNCDSLPGGHAGCLRWRGRT